MPHYRKCYHFKSTNQEMTGTIIYPMFSWPIEPRTHDNTYCSPNLSMTGREMNLPIDVMTGTSNMSSCPIQYVERVKSAINKAFELANSQSKKTAIIHKKYYDRGLNPRDFKSGDMVWRWYLPRANLKLGLGWIGPYMI